MADTGHRPRCLLISRPAVAGYPPALYQAELFRERGYDVTVADTGTTAEFRCAISHEDIAHQPLIAESGYNSKIGRIRRVLDFRRAAYQLVRKLRPELTVAYEVEACAAVKDGPLKSGGLLAWHFHEMWEPSESWSGHAAVRYARNNVSQPHIVIIPDADRAKVFILETGISASRVHVVMNCPRLSLNIAPSGHFEAKSRLAPASTKLIVYNGSVGAHHGLETAIRSMVDWPADAMLVIKGRSRPDYERHLVELASHCGVSHRLRRIPFSPGYWAYLGAHIGWTVLQPVSDNWTYSAGASNKRFECMAAGIPQITDNTAATATLISQVGCGVCIPPLDVRAAAAAVNATLADTELASTMGGRGRTAHLERFNYEAQFEPVLQWFEQHIRQ